MTEKESVCAVQKNRQGERQNEMIFETIFLTSFLPLFIVCFYFHMLIVDSSGTRTQSVAILCPYLVKVATVLEKQKSKIF